MSQKSKLWDSLFYFTIGTLYTYSLSRSVIAATVLQISAASLLLFCAISILIFYVCFFNRYTLISITALLLPAALLLYFYLRSRHFEVQWYRQAAAYLEELWLFIRGNIPYQEEYGLILGFGISFLIAIVAALNIRVFFNFYVLTLTGLGIIIVPIYLEQKRSDFAIGLFLLCFLIILLKKLNLFAMSEKKETEPSNGQFSLAVIPFGLLLFALSSLLPKPDIDIDRPQQFFQERLYAFNDFFNGNFRPKYFSYQSTAFTGNGTLLGGRLATDDRFVMEVFADEQAYLSGAIKDTYTGSTWIRSEEGKEELAADENNWYATDDYSHYLSISDVEKKSLTVNIGDRSTKTIFSPPLRTGIWFSDDVSLTKSSMGELSVDNSLDSYAIYTQVYFSWEHRDEQLIQLLRSASYSESAAEEGMAPYLQIPDTLPQRVIDLAHELTGDTDSDYEKIRALQEHLIQFRYTLEPEDIPPGEDFVDYFLFTGREGYCTYYATALAVMARSVGIPTRYLEGYILPEEQNGNGGYTVTNAQAHAWVEAYFPQLGWVPFEATVTYYENFYDEEPADSSEGPDESSSTAGDEDIASQNASPEDAGEESSSPNSSESSGMTATETGDTAQQSKRGPFLPVFALLIIAAALILAVRAFLYARRIKMIDGLSPRKAVIAYFSHIIKVAGALGYPMTRSETASQYANRITDRFPLREGAIRMTDLAEIFSRASYSENEISMEEKEIMRLCYHEMARALQKGRMGVLGYLLNRYILLKY